jgi:protein involved in polysaccharide export with SLBB domain
MKKVLSVLTFSLVLSAAVTARSQSNNIVPPGTETNAKGGESVTRSTTSAASTASVIPPSDSSGTTTDAPAKKVTTVPSGVIAKSPSKPDSGPTLTTNAENPLTNTYRVGVGDVLEIRLLNAPTRESKLFSVMSGGLLEYPLAGEPFEVSGLTTDEIDQRLTSRITLFEKPEIVVSVREFMSHNVIVTGLVNNPGTKVLRREAMPLYVVLAEAQLRPEAGRAAIVRGDGQTVTAILSEDASTSTLVFPGDVITVTSAPPPPPQYFYIGGQVNSPGQKDFHAGITLSQAVLASGGKTRFAGGKVKVSRQGPDGKLVITEYNLKQIESGKVPDPELQSGDRIELAR